MKVILFTTLLLFSINGFAYNWEKITETEEGHSLYVDVDNIKKHNGLVYFWVLGDKYEQGENGVYSYVVKFKVNCEVGKQTELDATFFNQQMGEGRIVGKLNRNEINYPRPGTHGYIEMKYACDNAK